MDLAERRMKFEKSRLAKYFSSAQDAISVLTMGAAQYATTHFSFLSHFSTNNSLL
jgi:hypothetical protein